MQDQTRTEQTGRPVTGGEPFQRSDRTAPFPYTLGEYARRFLWNLVQSSLFRWSPTRAFRWRGWLLSMFGAKVVGKVFIRRTTKVVHPWLLEIGDWAVVGDGVVVYNLGQVRIGAQSVVSQNAYLCAGTHDYTRHDLPLLRLPITIGNGVWVAAGAFIGPGVILGDNCVIGACSVVVKDIPAGVVAAGNPARVIKPRPMQDEPPG